MLPTGFPTCSVEGAAWEWDAAPTSCHAFCSAPGGMGTLGSPVITFHCFSLCLFIFLFFFFKAKNMHTHMKNLWCMCIHIHQTCERTRSLCADYIYNFKYISKINQTVWIQLVCTYTGMHIRVCGHIHTYVFQRWWEDTKLLTATFR